MMSMSFNGLLAALAITILPIFPSYAQNNSTSGLPSGLDALSSFESAEALHRRQVFFLGGSYQKNASTNLTNFRNQMYVEQLLPARGKSKPNPLVFFHGGGFSGATWLQTPDNRKGWASYFLDEGYAVFLVDVSSLGRSSRIPDLPVMDAAPAEISEQFFSAPQDTPSTYPQAKLHTQWPGKGTQGSPDFDAWYPSLLELPSNSTLTELAVQAAGCELLSKIGPSFLVAHSYGAVFPWLMADSCTEKVQGIFGIEPDTTPFESYDLPQAMPTRPYGISNAPLTYSPAVNDAANELAKNAVTVGTDTPGNRSCLLQGEPARKLPNLAKVPIYFYTTQASVHITYDHCLAAYLRQAGVPVQWQLLEDLGILGNGHFSFVEKNNLQLAKLADGWFKKHASKR